MIVTLQDILNALELNSAPNNCGLIGCAFEVAVKIFVGYPNTCVSSPSLPDMVIDGKTYEIKQNAGRLPNYDPDYIIYAPMVDLSKPIEQQFFACVPYEDFIDFMDTIGMVRWAKSESPCEYGRPRPTRETVASFQTVFVYSKQAPHSQIKFDMICDFLASHALPLPKIK